MKGTPQGAIIQPSDPSNEQFLSLEEPPKTAFYEVKSTCPFDGCGLSEMKGKRWASIEDAGIMLCTKAPEKVDCLNYNNEYRKLVQLEEDLNREGISVMF